VKSHIEREKEVMKIKKNTLKMKKDEIEKLKVSLKSKTGHDLKISKVEEEAEELEKEIETRSRAITDMNNVVETLEQDEDDQLARQQQVQSEINHLKRQLAEQSVIRVDMYTKLNSLKHNFEKARDDSALRAVADQANDVKIVAGSHAKKGEGAFGLELNHITPMTRVEREMELLSLKRQLHLETAETERLRAIADQAKEYIEKALKMQAEERGGKKPQWVKLLNENATKSATIRINVKEKAAAAVESGGVMSFREKLLFFTSTPLKE